MHPRSAPPPRARRGRAAAGSRPRTAPPEQRPSVVSPRCAPPDLEPLPRQRRADRAPPTCSSMVGLAAPADPDVVCLQELPLWALGHLGGWSGMPAIGAVAAPLCSLPRGVARRLTDARTRAASARASRARRTRSSSRGAARPRQHVHRAEPARSAFRRAARRRRSRRGLAWAKERRVCQAVALALPDGRTMTRRQPPRHGLPLDERLADAEVLRAAVFAGRAWPRPGDVAVLAGDFNLRAERSRTLARDRRPSGASRCRARGSTTSSSAARRRRRSGVAGRAAAASTARSLSDHAPVEVTVE